MMVKNSIRAKIQHIHLLIMDLIFTVCDIAKLDFSFFITWFAWFVGYDKKFSFICVSLSLALCTMQVKRSGSS